MWDSSHKFRESMALIFQKFNIGFICDIDMNTFGTPGTWSSTRWILTVSKVLMIPQQFWPSGKNHVVSSPFLCKIKIKEKSRFFVLWFLQIKMTPGKRCVCCVRVIALACPQTSLCRRVCQEFILHEEIRSLAGQHHFWTCDWLVYTSAVVHLLDALISWCKSELTFDSLHHSRVTFNGLNISFFIFNVFQTFIFVTYTSVYLCKFHIENTFNHVS